MHFSHLYITSVPGRYIKAKLEPSVCISTLNSGLHCPCPWAPERCLTRYTNHKYHRRINVCSFFKQDLLILPVLRHGPGSGSVFCFTLTSWGDAQTDLVTPVAPVQRQGVLFFLFFTTQQPVWRPFNASQLQTAVGAVQHSLSDEVNITDVAHVS